MSAAAGERVRSAAVAGSFYDGDSGRCAVDVKELCVPYESARIPDRVLGALVPHAGWVYSGRIAGRTLTTFAARTDARSFLLLGSVHYAALEGPALESSDAWWTPLGPVRVDAALRAALARLDAVTVRDDVHRPEHSLEVQVPLLLGAFTRHAPGRQRADALSGELSSSPTIRIVPCLVPPADEAMRWGRATGRILSGWHEPVGVIISTDLTHYGPRFGFAPGGTGQAGRHWAADNDRALLAKIATLDAPGALAHAVAHCSACGGGAIAFGLAAMAEMGATGGVLLQHADSADAGAAPGSRVYEFVGYAGVVFG